MLTHNLGFPRIGLAREYKRALEAYWAGRIDADELQRTGRELRARHWRLQADAGIDLLPVGDFSWYDHVLDLSHLLGVVPARYGSTGAGADAGIDAEGQGALDLYFRMARGRARAEPGVPACEMTKWFDTNYHYLVPEFAPDQRFSVRDGALFAQVTEARALGHHVKPVLVGPLTYLWLGKTPGLAFDRLSLLDELLPAYGEILHRLRSLGCDWVQIDEPILALDLPADWRCAFEPVYSRLREPGLNQLLAVYHGPLRDNLGLAVALPVAGLHVDLVRAAEELPALLDRLPAHKVLSCGVVDGRNVWRTDLAAARQTLDTARQRLGERLWLAPSCSLQHVPIDLAAETALDPALRDRLAFARQKLDEVVLLQRALHDDAGALAAIAARSSTRSTVALPGAAIEQDYAYTRSPYPQRAALQNRALGLPPFPTTTIGSLPQTVAIRQARADYKAGRSSAEDYENAMRAEIADHVRRQEMLGLDVLVHGEAERNDMVEYFAELLDGFAVTANGWVQSYGSRCVKPAIIHADVVRSRPMTVRWTAYAQSLTNKPMKGMLTGPVTMLQWSFVRDDQPRAQTCRQIAAVLRAEVADLEQAGIRIIQIDEPAFREGLPLRRAERQTYIDWAVSAFRIAAAGASDAVQIHTHMCYSEFNELIDAIAALDADVITIEAARSGFDLLDAFAEHDYPNAIGPGVYDIHTPRVPGAQEMTVHLEQMATRIAPERLWVNPDCGLKTRAWVEVEPALANMVAAARLLREKNHGEKSV